MKNYLIIFFIIVFLKVGINVKANSFNIDLKEDSFDIIVSSKSGPWNPLINKSKDYGFKPRHRFKSGHDQASPSILKVSPGDDLIIQCIDGHVCADCLGYPERKTDADGYPKTIHTYTGKLPSLFIDDEVNHMALIGTFADSKGVIVGLPFFVGNGPVNLVVPEGAEQLQLGINDNLFKDNAGLFIVKVNINK